MFSDFIIKNLLSNHKYYQPTVILATEEINIMQYYSFKNCEYDLYLHRQKTKYAENA